MIFSNFACSKETSVEELLGQLNERQREAVTYVDGPSLVVAGAGSGKTRVLTYKIAYLLGLGLPPYGILALTFTNKAAREMKARVATLTDPTTASQLWMGTFHSIFARILRRKAERIGYPSNFTIYDSTDSKSLLKAIIKEMGLDDKSYRPAMVQGRISNAKNTLITAADYVESRELMEADMHAKVPLIGEIYHRYQNRCRQAGAMDFDDLLLWTYLLFTEHADVREQYSRRFRYVLVDEYQDTNTVQHKIIQCLCERHGRICVVGDDAQSIYSFRGANIDNILQFQRQFKGCQVFKLERNYRSTQNIVNAANSLIDKNQDQIPKTIYSEKEEGHKLLLKEVQSDYEEAYIVAAQINRMQRQEGYSYAEFAVLYRTNAQSRVLEEALRKRGMPYKIYGGLSFYQRKEVKDVIAYFRLIVNPHDEEALKRVINYPARGIGDTTVGKVVSAATNYGVSLWTILADPSAYPLPVNTGTQKKLDGFRDLILEMRTQDQVLPADELAAWVVKRSGVFNDLMQDRSIEGVSKQENLQELLRGVIDFCSMRREEGQSEVKIAGFLSEVALLTDQDNDKDDNADKVTLMTVHSAKGLEFKNVFVVGMEEDLFPSALSKDHPRAIEEERRLFYVAITRAEQNCMLSYARSRYRNGKMDLCTPSRFLKDIDTKYLDILDGNEVNVNPFVSSWGAIQRQTQFQSTLFTEPRKPRLRSMRNVSQNPIESPVTTSFEGNANGLRVGTIIRHDKFGKGEVMSLEGTGNNAKAMIQFELVGQKVLLLKYAKLTVLE